MRLYLFSNWLVAALVLSFLSGCGKNDDSAGDDSAQAKPPLKAEDQENDRKARRDRLRRDKELYLARLQGSARDYGAKQSAPEVEKNLKVFKYRYEGYVREVYTPALRSLGLTRNPFPASIAPIDPSLKQLGVNFYTDGSYAIPRDRQAGVPALQQAQWNNLSHSQTRAPQDDTLKGSATNLHLASGQPAAGLELSWQANELTNDRNNPQADAPGTLLLMSSCLEGEDVAFTLKGLDQAGFRRYDLVIYLEYALDELQQDGAQQPVSRVDLWESAEKKSLIASDLASAVKVGGNAYPGQVRSYTRQQYDDRKLLCSNTGKPGQYVYFANLTAASLYFEYAPPAFGKVKQFRLAGLQVIERP
ncbi:MAG: hypothetical protein H7A51_13130 [Akkermansiaceae bacterium]|nr:hypothetical protein [Akkermansiaceae bacterium]